MSNEKQSILVIKHGALGDIIIATAGFAAIRAQHPEAHIVCLTTKAYAPLLSQSPYFNEIWVDKKPKFLDRAAVGKLRAMLRSREWSWVYDLQTSTRSTYYQWLLKRPWPRISNVSRWASHGYTDKTRHQLHAFENIKRQLAVADIAGIGLPDISWLKADLAGLQQKNRYALLVPGGAAHRPEKRWPAGHYAALAQHLVVREITPLLIGTEAEAQPLEAIARKVPFAVNLCGKTSIAQLAELARGSVLAVGNDTGPMHVIAAAGCPSLVLFSAASNPTYSAPTGHEVMVMREENLADLSIERVMERLTARL